MFDLFNQPEPPDLKFDGSDYDEALDKDRLTGQVKDIFELMKDGKWRTLGEIETVVKHPQASISAQLRNMRKARFGKYQVLRQRRGDRKQGLFEYQVLPPLKNIQAEIQPIT